MGIWTLQGAGSGNPETHGPAPSTSQAGSQITTGTNTMGAWAQLTAGLAYPSAGIFLQFEQISAGGERHAFEIGIGAPGSEIVVLPAILYQGTAQGVQYLPIALPAGVPISARGQSTASVTARVALYATPEGLGVQGIQRWTTYGMNLAGATAGTSIDAGAVANTLSAWVQLSAAITNPIRCIHLLTAGEAIAANTISYGLLDIGIGAAGQEQVVLDRITFRLTAAATGGWAMGPFYVNPIPAGTRLAVRHQANSTVVASSRNMQWAVLAGG